MTRKKWINIIAYGLVIVTSLSCANIFSEMSSTAKTSDKAILFDAQVAIDKGDWDTAITKIADLSADYQARRDVQNLLASAYAGKCGLNFLSLIDKINQGTGGRLMQTLFAAFTSSSAAKITSCITAENVLKGIGATAALRTSEENLQMAFLALAKMGAILNFYGDNDTNLSTDDGDNTLDPGFTGCEIANFSEAMADELVTGVSLFYTSLTAAATSGIAADQLTALETVCNISSACNITSTTDVTAGHRFTIRGMIREDSSVGLGICTGDTATCSCNGT